MQDIRIDVGVYTALEIDLTAFVFTGISKVILTIKDKPQGDIVAEHEFTTAAKHYIDITPEQSRKLTNSAYYDFDIITQDGKRYKNGGNGKIVLRRGCGECSL